MNASNFITDNFTFQGYPPELVVCGAPPAPNNVSDSLTGKATRDFVSLLDDLAFVTRSISENRELLALLA